MKEGSGIEVAVSVEINDKRKIDSAKNSTLNLHVNGDVDQLIADLEKKLQE